MNARWFASILVFMAIALTLPCVSGDTDIPDLISQIIWGPVLTNMATDSVTISWATEEPVRGTVAYAEMAGHVPGIPDRTITEGNASEIHRIRLDNLTPDRTYVYSVSGSAREHSFRTFPEQGPISFVVYGDTREQLPTWNQSTHHALVASRIVAEPDLRFVIHTGDLINDPADSEEWDRFFAAAAPMLDHVPFYPVAGNHEGSPGVIQEIFGVPPWYVISCGDVRVVVLDSNPLNRTMTLAQDDFVARNPAQGSAWTFVALHHPPYSADPNHPGGFRNVRERWEPVFKDEGVIAVFSGHVHAYEHIERNGIHYFTVGTGGAPPYQLSSGKPEGYVAGLENTLGYAVVTVDPKTQSAEIDFVEVANTRETGIYVFPAGTVYERIDLSNRFPRPLRDAYRFPTIFTSHFGDTRIKLLS